ncbi:MAG: ChbG/HpnK family deacetylase [Pseudolabrys sp.]
MTAPRRLWLCADDYGMTRGVSAAIRDLIAQGRINATSVMMPATALADDEVAALRKLKDDGRCAIGLHLTLTAPFRPLDPAFQPLRDGTFLPLASMLAAATARRLDAASLTREINAQIAAFTKAFDQKPDFLDGHQHVQLFPQVRDAFLRSVATLAPKAWVRQCGRTTTLPARLRDPKGLLLDVLSVAFRRRAARLGVATNRGFAGTYDFATTTNVATLFPRFLEDLPDNSVVMCHPGHVDDELRQLDPLTDPRAREYDYLASGAFGDVLTQRGFALA